MSGGGEASEREDGGPLRVAALVYQVGRERIGGTYLAPDGRRENLWLAEVASVLPALDGLRAELNDGMALARGRVPQLRAFSRGWGRSLLPDAVLADPPDVLVVVPHAMLHDVPLHLVHGADHVPLGCGIGVSYASSMSLFTRCVARNPARRHDPVAWSPRPPRKRTFAAGGADLLTGREGMFRALPLMLADMFARTDLIDRQRPGMTRRAVKDAVAAAPDVLMLVAHGIVDGTDHRMSGLLLHQQHDGGWWDIELAPGQTLQFRDLPLADPPRAGARGGPVELLTASELEINAQLRSELVVLLACSAGSGRVLEGDEPASLAETVLRLGAASVVAALWDADFAATRDWVAAFFVAWLMWGYPKALAARHAMGRLYARVGDERPDLCGALTVRGDWL
ncbi:CHAT domain-containing protein [Streptomyces sp. NPDC051987]|uniref:CHAT domain-containing protein n=1 Tax=Streptomyces sp. NPDC051987 TaxID=3155808 RepID=UPI00341D7867